MCWPLQSMLRFEVVEFLVRFLNGVLSKRQFAFALAPNEQLDLRENQLVRVRDPGVVAPSY